jgi:membrane protease YdiL (CAAX protease family)
VSTPDNPIPEPAVPAQQQLQVTDASGPTLALRENPPWTVAEVLALAVLTGVTIFGCILAALALHLHLANSAPWVRNITPPEIMVGGQLLAYILIFILVYKLVENHSQGRVLEAIRWNWPPNWRSYLLAGVGLEISLLPLTYLLPMPKNLPIDEFFKTTRDAYLLSLFGIFIAPLFEELFFRGFLYPALARRFGVSLSIVLTALGFAAIHAPQLRASWGPVLVMFLVGLVLTTVRAIKKSVAATVLMHMAYNGGLFVVAYLATDGFRHMEKFNQ